MTITRHRFWVSAALVLAASVTIFGFAAAAAPDAGCTPVAGPISESTEFTPWENQLSSGFDPILDTGGVAAPAAPRTSSLPGISQHKLAPLQLEIGSAGGGVYGYYIDEPIDGMTLSSFIAKGGIQLEQEPMTDELAFATYLVAELGERATPVTIGEHEGALVWADPSDATGIRTHNLYWSDGAYNYALIGNLGAETIVNLGRSLACGA